MSATLSAGVNSVILKLDTPYDSIRTADIRDDLVKVKVWCSTTANFTPADDNLVFNALSLSIVISKLANGNDLVAGTTYYVKYAFISDIDETVYTVSSQLTAIPIVASAQTVDISGYSAFVKSNAGTYTPSTATLTAVLNGIVTPVYAWTISGGTLSAANTASVTVTPAANATSVTVTLSVTGVGITTTIVKSIVMAVVNDGQNATAYGLVVSAGAIQKTKAGVLNPTTITVYGYSAVGITTPGLYAGRFKIYENGSATARYTSAANESSYTYTPSSSNITSIKAELYLAGGTVNKVDEQAIPVVVDGTDTITAVLSNESATVPASSDGTVTSFAGASTVMSVYIGATDDSANWTYAVTKSNVTCTEAVTSRTQTVTALSAVSGYVDITASKTGYSSITKRFNINKAVGGIPGTSPLVYDIVTSSPVIVKDAPDAATTGTYSTITIQGKKYDGNTTVNYGWITVTADGATEATTATDTASAAYSLTPASNSGKSTYTVKLYSQATVNGATLLDTQVIYAVFKGNTGGPGAAGISALTAILSNETHVFPASNSGAVSDYTSSGTTIRVYEGATELVYDGSGTTASTWTVAAAVSNITAGAISDSGTYATVAAHSGVASGTDVSSVTYTITGKNSAGTVFTITKTQTFSKAKIGAPGTSPLVYDIITSSPVIVKDAPDAATTGTYSTITIQGKKYDGNTTANYGWITVTADGVAEATTATDTASSAYSLTPASNSGKSTYTVKLYSQATVSGATLLDTQVITVVYKGTQGTAGNSTINAILSNTAHVFPANNDGSITSYANSGTQLRVYEGATELLYDGAGTTNGTWTFSTGTPANITVGSVTDSGSYATIGVHSGVSSGTDSSAITYTITGKSSTGVSFTITQTQTFSKAKTGAVSTTPGLTGASTYRAYIATANSTTAPAWTAGTTSTNGAIPAVGWSLTPVALTGTQAQWQVDGTNPAGSTTTTWSTPYPSYFKVSNLAAVAVDTGSLVVTDIIKVGSAASTTNGVLITTAGIEIYNAGVLRVKLGSI